MATLVEQLAARDAKAAEGNWYPACVERKYHSTLAMVIGYSTAGSRQLDGMLTSTATLTY